MKIILNGHADDDFRFAAQLGVDGIVSSFARDQTPHGFYEFNRLVALRSAIEEYGLSMEGLALLPWHLCYKWMLGLPGKDEQIENVIKSIRNMGAAGVPLLVFNMHALRFYRTSRNAPERGGSTSTKFEYERVKDAPLWAGGMGTDTASIPDELKHPIDDEEMWANYTYFVRAAVPEAEKAGVKLALHPDDPQVPVIGGVARIMRSPDAFRRAMEIMPSESLGLKYCTGCFAQMGADQVKEITYWGTRNKLLLIDFRNIRGVVDNFQETFLENGKENMLELMKALWDSGFRGPIGPDHAVHITVGEAHNRLYWAYAIGQMKTMLQAVRYFG